MNERKQYSLVQEVKVDYKFIWTIIKLWVKRKNYKVTISFHAKHNSETKFTGIQLEY